MEEKIYSTKEFAKALGISKNHLLKLETEGKVPLARRVEKGKVSHRYYTVEDILEYRTILGMSPLIDQRRVQIFLNFKGGTGKSTISASYAYCIAELGIPVLAIDLDAQQHMTKCLGFEPERDTKCIYEVLVEDVDINEVILPTKLPTLDIIPANIKLSIVESRLSTKELKEFLLTSALKRIQCKDYKIIVIDSLPNMTLLNKIALLAGDDLLVPVLADFLSYDGLGLLFEELIRIDKTFFLYTNHMDNLLDRIYVFINQYRPNELMSRQNKTALEKYYAKYLCETIIPYNSKLAQATATGMPIFQYDRNCPAAKQIRSLVDEILQLSARTGRRKKAEKEAEEVEEESHE